MNDKTGDQKPGILAHTVDNIMTRRKMPVSVFIVLMVLYIVTNMVVSRVAGSQGVIRISDSVIPLQTFAGVFSSMANICVIFMAVYFGKPGFFAALALILINMPGVIMGVVVRHNFNSLPGVFTNILTIITIIIIFINNERLNRTQDRIREQAVTDMLTGLPNRFACLELVKELERRKETYAFVGINLNGFKSINDTMGFTAGNEVLKEVASRWKHLAESGETRTLDFIARMGGDEFVLLVRKFQDEEDIVRTIRKYEKALGERLTIDGCDFFISASFGFSIFPTDTADREALYSYADAAMHEAKRANSSDHIRRFTRDMLKEDHILEVEGKIRTALQNDTFFFHLQPQYDMDHRLRGFEALARMRDENGNIVSPGEFIPVAEKVGLIDQVDSAIFRKSAAFFGDLLKISKADITLSINASVRHLMKNDFLDEVRDLLKNSGIPAEQLEIEITESIMIESMEKALYCINEIKKMGVKIAIDDFGTGYSSLSYLNNFPANLLKIDKSFIDKMNSSDSSKQYVASIISIGHIMGFDVISEGVEEPDQLETLRAAGCDYIQGYIWGRPLPQEEAEKIVLEFAGE
ncbi:MAG: EAL domain-containing protein [Lachnospiraceae bacterium]|nr:EAL domain-containing protein [Lachnospiraceae bacterium]